jgi:hypothetical protein
MSVSPPHANERGRPIRRGLAVLSLLALLGVACASPALAAEGAVTAVAAPAATATAATATGATKCEGQAFSQPFAQLGDFNYYTLAPGGQFNSAEEGWQLSGGARIVEAARPDESDGGVLELPAGAEAVSPPMCVTLLYPTARMYVRRLEGGGTVKVSVFYPNLKKPRSVANLKSKPGQWELSAPFEVRPQLGGESEETREVQFTLSSRGEGEATYDVYGLYVDPRML